MGNKAKLVAQSYYEISDVSGSSTVLDVDRDQNVFTLLKNTYTADGMRHISLNELEQHINEYKPVMGAKTGNQAILKGLYLDGFNGVNCVKNAPYLFFDIDVKEKKENTHLLAPATNEVIFRTLKDIAVLVWRSNSGNGIAGILYVPQMAEYLNDRRDLHLQVGKKITSYLSDYLHNETGIIRIKFDDAQSKLRQIRYLALQEQTREINNKPFVFTYLVEEKTKYIAPNVPAYRYNDHRTPYGTIYEQFNNSNDILSVAQQNGFTIVSNSGNKIRLKHPNTTSATSGEIDTGLNLYFNYSDSVSSKRSFTPSEMVCYFSFSGNWYNFRKYLVEQGYQEKAKPQNEVKQTAENLKRELATSTAPDKAIFSACYDLQTLTDVEKQKFIKETCLDNAHLPYFKAYLNLQDYRIKYDANFYIKKYVAEALPEILEYADQHHKIILRAETGKGKTTAFIRDFHKHRPNARLLVLVPLTVILRQNKKEYGNKGVFVDGSNVSYELEKTYYESLVFATYEQGAKILHYSNFDYVVIDEAHQLINANSYKKEVIADLVPHLETNKIIGLTGTPSEIFKHIGYKLANVDLKTPERTKLNVRYSNSKTADIALQHLSNVEGKTIIRLNEIKTLDEVKIRLLRDYAEDEILILHSTEEIKKGSDYNGLAYDRAFTEKVKIVLTTSLIDEGLSIDQKGFTDVVLIETSYTPKPEPIKQFFARFRNVDNNRKNFVYLRQKDDQSHGRFNIGYSFRDTLKTLENEAGAFEVDEMISTYKSLFSNADFFLDDGTINKYYLGYSVNDILFRTLNKDQFREYLTTNFLFSLTVDEQKQEAQRYATNGNRKQIKRDIASLWKNSFDEVMHTLSVHSLDMGIRNALERTQTGVSQEVADFIIKHIKDFEKLFKAKKQIHKLGVDDENIILLKMENDLSITLNSQQEVKKSIHLLKLKNVLDNPKTKADHKEKERFEMLAQWCRSRKEFTNPEMFRYLKKIGVRNILAFNEAMIFDVLKWYNLEVKRDKNYNVLRC